MNTTFHDRRVTIIGMAREGTALARFLARGGAKVTVSDTRGIAELADEIGQLAGLPIQCVLRGHPPDILNTDVVFVSPGVPREVPILRQAAARGLPLSSETELLFDLCPAPIIGITGSSGKTTTTTLIGGMLKTDRRRRVWVGGNIGKPLIEDVAGMRPDDWVALELSSFQLEHLRRSPHIAVLTNVRPNHLDRHSSYEAYKEAKSHILRFQSADDVAVLNWDDPESRDFAALTQGRVRWFSHRERLPEGTFVDDHGAIIVQHGGETLRICSVEQVALPGSHNLENLLAAVSVAAAVGISPAAVARVATSFRGVEHRLELVREHRGVRWINDSIATSPDRTIAALHAFSTAGEPQTGPARGGMVQVEECTGQRIVLLAGGRDKHLPMDEMAREIMTHVKHLVLFGESAPVIQQAIESARAQANGSGRAVALTVCRTLEEAVAVADEVAESGDIVLLSPSGTSFDVFKDFESRGQRFKELVRAL
ncbi:MAG: UDP-N-acetylmuramoyl-L-alanine--D-glutamate ligase [Ardenticatenaceae bacterium]|nr:UDP-N-acetylmuramoyl-L-alanine--D-glutamate ligase [Ardenticatenaceae bacterium]HBY97784.1 UDP-N-acetylmuramoyl-L-alanine--D-glutamate ligase [Chloroflexota bacterium]